MSLDRNGACFCGSGKKYKKCCANKGIVKICYDTLPPEESSHNFFTIPAEDQKVLDLLPSKILKESDPFFTTVFSLIEKYPNVPSLRSYLVDGYAQIRNFDKMYRVIQETYEKFPNYLFARTAQVLACLNQGNLEKAKELLGSYTTLQELYPNREVFHVSEFSAFHHAKAQQACRLQNKQEALLHLNALEKALPINDPLLQEVQQAVARLS